MPPNGVVTLGVLTKDFSIDPVAAKKKYASRRFKVIGTVSKVERGNGTIPLIVILSDQNGNSGTLKAELLSGTIPMYDELEISPNGSSVTLLKRTKNYEGRNWGNSPYVEKVPFLIKLQSLVIECCFQDLCAGEVRASDGLIVKPDNNEIKDAFNYEIKQRVRITDKTIQVAPNLLKSSSTNTCSENRENIINSNSINIKNTTNSTKSFPQTNDDTHANTMPFEKSKFCGTIWMTPPYWLVGFEKNGVEWVARSNGGGKHYKNWHPISQDQAQELESGTFYKISTDGKSMKSDNNKEWKLWYSPDFLQEKMSIEHKQTATNTMPFEKSKFCGTIWMSPPYWLVGFETNGVEWVARSNGGGKNYKNWHPISEDEAQELESGTFYKISTDGKSMKSDNNKEWKLWYSPNQH